MFFAIHFSIVSCLITKGLSPAIADANITLSLHNSFYQ